jgi:hypothetical protein
VSDLLAYPPSAPRLLASPAARNTAAPYVAATSRAARARWRLAGSPLVGRFLWRAPAREVSAAWDLGASFLREGRQTLVGVLGDDGPAQRLTLIPAAEDVVVKVAVRPLADAIVERERESLVRLEQTAWRDLGPRARADSRAATAPRAVLLMDRVVGDHPSWDDSGVHVELLRVLSDESNGSAGLHHGDVTPWNVVRRADGTLVLLDWEFADFDASAHPACGLLDFVLRGAAAARAPVTHVRPVLLEALRSAGIDSQDSDEVLRLYRAYRDRVREVSGDRPDTLTRDADRLLCACLEAR